MERDWTKLVYSINKGLWGTSVGGRETLTSDRSLPEEAYPSSLQRVGEEELTLAFEQGELCAVNGKTYADKIEAIRAVEALAAPWAIGRDTHVGDTIVGIKGRVGFEAAAPLITGKTHVDEVAVVLEGAIGQLVRDVSARGDVRGTGDAGYREISGTLAA